MLLQGLHRLTSHRISLLSIQRIPLKCTISLRLQQYTTNPVSQDDPVLSETNCAETTLKRFWKTVDVDSRDNGFTVTLDKRAIKTPSGNTLLLPKNKRLAATLIAYEWNIQDKFLKPHALPMTSIAARAIDTLRDENMRAKVHVSLLNYLDTDTVCFHYDASPPLVELQQKHWDPLLKWARATFDVEILVFDSVLCHSQPERTKEILGDVVAQMDPWEMAAMERATYVLKSFLIALALVKRHLTVEEAALASQVEVMSQIQRWGEVEDTHDVDFHDTRRQLGSAACLFANMS